MATPEMTDLEHAPAKTGQNLDIDLQESLQLGIPATEDEKAQSRRPGLPQAAAEFLALELQDTKHLVSCWSAQFATQHFHLPGLVKIARQPRACFTSS